MKFKERWINFLSTIFDPWVIILLIFTILLGIALVVSSEKIIQIVFTLLLSIVSGVVGSTVFNRWEVVSGEKTIITRGKLSIRNLKQLLNNVQSLRERVTEYLLRIKKEDKSKESIIYFEEILLRCSLLEDQTVNSIENWTDIIPDAEIKDKLDELAELRGELELKMKSLIDVEKELRKRTKRTEAVVEGLKKQKDDYEKQVLELRKEIQTNRKEVGLTSITPYVSGSSGLIFGASGVSGSGGLYIPEGDIGAHVVFPK